MVIHDKKKPVVRNYLLFIKMYILKNNTRLVFIYNFFYCIILYLSPIVHHNAAVKKQHHINRELCTKNVWEIIFFKTFCFT